MSGDPNEPRSSFRAEEIRRSIRAYKFRPINLRCKSPAEVFLSNWRPSHQLTTSCPIKFTRHIFTALQRKKSTKKTFPQSDCVRYISRAPTGRSSSTIIARVEWQLKRSPGLFLSFSGSKLIYERYSEEMRAGWIIFNVLYEIQTRRAEKAARVRDKGCKLNFNELDLIK